ncbi:MAG: 4-vinyl reductase [Acholeplasmatales bacterium]|jgi:predicted hydrocarbon binding protein|nr:4-vinyl reductase [Acholeplasmatales bacterium]
MDKEYKKFEWEDLGNIVAGREHLGEEMPVIVYRLFEFTTKDILSKHFGHDKAKELIRECGFLAGTEFYLNVLNKNHEDLSFEVFVSILQKALKDFKIGILKVESADLSKKKIMLTVAEDIDCSGMPLGDEAVCNYDEGFIAGILHEYSGVSWDVTEIDCWATGDRVCRFRIIGKD